MGLAQQPSVMRQHLEREPVQRPVGDDDQATARVGDRCHRSKQDVCELGRFRPRLAVRALRCTAFARRAMAPA